jgi:hypothetical protein
MRNNIETGGGRLSRIREKIVGNYPRTGLVFSNTYNKLGERGEFSSKKGKVFNRKIYKEFRTHHGSGSLGMVADGNEPLILAAALQDRVGAGFAENGMGQPIVVLPYLPSRGRKQEDILLEENPDYKGRIYFDEKAGKIVDKITGNQGNFAKHIDNIIEYHAGVEDALNAHYRKETITLRSIVTKEEAKNGVKGEKILFSPKKIDFVVEAGNRVSPTEFPNRYFAFPALFSRIAQETMNDLELGFDAVKIQQARDIVKKGENYSLAFIPRENTFSHQYEKLDDQPSSYGESTIIYTPPLKEDKPEISGEAEPGIYVMFSGTGGAAEANAKLVEAASRAGLKVYVPPWVKIDGAETKLPSILADKNIKAIVGRSGWGTVWQARQYGKALLLTAYQKGDDPEISNNNKTIEKLGYGKVITPEWIENTSSEDLTKEFQKLSLVSDQLKAEDKNRWGTADGLKVAADAIVNDLAERGVIYTITPYNSMSYDDRLCFNSICF